MSLTLEKRHDCFKVPTGAHMFNSRDKYIGRFRCWRWVNEAYIDMDKSFELSNGEVAVYLSQQTGLGGSASYSYVERTVTEMCKFGIKPNRDQGQGVLW